MSLRVVFCGTPEFAIPSLDAVVDSQHQIALVVSQPDRRRGRRASPSPTPLRERALEHGLPTRTLEKGGRGELYDEVLALDPDVVIVVAFGHIVREPLLSAGRHGCVNVHASLLPRWRGPAPIHRAILAGDEVTGVCSMRLAAGVDTGDTYLEKRTTIAPLETAGQLLNRLATLGGEVLVETLAGLEEGTVVSRPQPEVGITYAAMLDKQEGSVDFAEAAARVHNRIRGLDPWPGVTVQSEGRRLRLAASSVAEVLHGSAAAGSVLEIDESGMTVACGEGGVHVARVQPSGRKAMTPLEFAHGSGLEVGSVLRPIEGFAPKDEES